MRRRGHPFVLRYRRAVPSSTAPPSPRSDRLDALRAAAMLWMAGFHLCFDLNQSGLIAKQNFYADPFWTVQRTCIVSLFVFCAGVGQALGMPGVRAETWPARFWRRWAQVAGCALLVTLASWWMFPRSFIYFGVLHGMAVMLLIVRPSLAWGRWLWPLGLLAVLLPQFVAHPVFDTRLTDWVGLVTRKPITQDYVPVLPWLGVMWWGVAAGQWARQQRQAWLAARLPAALVPLAALGRWPLSFYMLHQPVLIGLVMGVATMLR